MNSIKINIKIEYFGHACFKAISGDFSVIIDPYAKKSIPGLNDLEESANMVIKSHDHFDHNAVEEVEIIESENCPFEIETYGTYHDDKKGELRGTNNVTILKKDGKKIVHLGDIGCDLDDALLDKIIYTDVLMIPIGGVYTIDYKKAKEFCNKIKPKVIIPMHYKGDDFGLENLDNVDKFIGLFDDVKFMDSYEFEFGEGMEDGKVILMKVKGKKCEDKK